MGFNERRLMGTLSIADKVKILEQNGDLYMDPDGSMVFMAPGGWGRFYETEFNKPHDFYVAKLWRMMRHRLLVEIRNAEKRKAGDLPSM